jgi:CRP/FNR family transcriptional regulator
MRNGTSERIDELRRVPLFADLDSADLAGLAGSSSRRVYRQRELIAGSHEAGHAWVIIHGTARVYGLSPRGREITIERLAAGDIYGLVLLDAAAPGACLLEATAEHTIVYRFPIRSIEALCLARPAFALSVIRLLSRRLIDARARIEDFAIHDAKAHLAHTLARLASEDGQVAETHRELAGMIGTRPEEVTKLLRQLREEGHVSYEAVQRALKVNDLDRLRSYGG